MRAITIEQVLKHVEEFEGLVTEFYRDISLHSPREGVRFLTDYMSRHSHHIKAFLSDLPQEAVRHILTVPLSYEPHVPDCHCFEKIDLPPDAEASQVLDAAVLLDECLMQLYRQIVRKPVDRQIRELFEELILTLEKEEIEFKKMKALNYF